MMTLTKRHRELLSRHLQACLVGRSKESPSEWAVKNFVFDEPDNHGPFRLSGNEYVADVLNDFAKPTISDIALVWGSQTKKTGTLMAGLAWCIVNDPCGMLWAMPNETLAQKFSQQRLQPAFRATDAVRRLIPTGVHRHSFKSLSMMMGGAILNLIGTHSAANLASNPCRRVFGDELDKFNEGGAKEADAVNLLDQRTKDQVNPQRWKTSTPTVTDGLIWQEYLKGNQMRYFVPCPYCGERVVFGWSKDYTVLPLTGVEAWIAWDQEARGRDGAWDLDRVKASAHAVCPHCKGKIGNEHKTGMVRLGEWRATNTSAPSSFVSRHLSSLYSTSTETTFGVLAVKFLQSKRSMNGTQGFINGDLAEPYENQESRGRRVEIVVSGSADPVPGSEPILTADFQAVAPYIWMVVRAWAPGGHSRLVWAGHCDDWDSLRRIQLRFAVPDRSVVVDSGFQASTVYEQCLRWGLRMSGAAGGLPYWLGWLPSKGREKEARWVDPDTKQPRPFFLGSAPLPPATRIHLPLLEFSGEFILDWLTRLRKGPGDAGIRWEVVTMPTADDIPGAVPVTEADYWLHMDAKVRRPKVINRKVQYVWEKWKQTVPDHILDCEIQQIAAALLKRKIPYASPQPAK